MSQTVKINETPGLLPPTVHFSQGDIGREFIFEIVSGNGYEIPSGATVECVGTKPSGYGFAAPCTVSGNTVTLTATDNDGEVFTDEAGRFQAELRITSGSDVIGTANFYMQSERDPHPTGTIDGEADQAIPILARMVAEINENYTALRTMTVSATTLEPGESATAAYNPDTNSLVIGVPRGGQLEATDDGDGNIEIDFV